jgi:hypothetical protein
MNPIERRLQKVEAVVDVDVIAPDQRDPKLIPVFQTLMGDRYCLDAVPCGVSCSDYVTRALAAASGTGFKPVKLPAGSALFAERMAISS